MYLLNEFRFFLPQVMSELYFLTFSRLLTEPPSPYLENSGNEVDVLPGQRELKVAAVQGVPQVPSGPKSGRLAQYIMGPRALLVQEGQHVLELAEV